MTLTEWSPVLREALARSHHDFTLQGQARPRRNGQAQRRQGGAQRVAAGFEREDAVARRSWIKPRAVLFGLVAIGLSGGVFINALMMQEGDHPSPLFAASLKPNGSTIVAAPPRAPAPAMPEALQPMAAPASRSPVQTQAQAPAPAAARVAAPPAQQADPIGDMLRGGAPAAAPRAASRPTVDPIAALMNQPAAKPQPVPAVAAAQRALTRLGYGPLSDDGLMGPGTRRAIERFEKDKGLPVSGELGSRTTRALTSAAGGALR